MPYTTSHHDYDYSPRARDARHFRPRRAHRTWDNAAAALVYVRRRSWQKGVVAAAAAVRSEKTLSARRNHVGAGDRVRAEGGRVDLFFREPRHVHEQPDTVSRDARPSTLPAVRRGVLRVEYARGGNSTHVMTTGRRADVRSGAAVTYGNRRRRVAAAVPVRHGRRPRLLSVWWPRAIAAASTAQRPVHV